MSDERINNEALKRLSNKEEPRFLSILLKDKDSLMDAVAFGIKGGTNGHFWNQEAKFLFEIILANYKKYGSILTRTSIESIMDAMETYGGKEIDDDDRTNVRLYWDKVYNMESDSEDYQLLRDHINSRFVQWQAYKILRSEMDEIVKSTNNQIEVVERIRESFLTIEGVDADTYTLTMGIGEGLEKAIEYINNRRDNPEDIPSVRTFLKAIDRIYHGFDRGSYTIISGFINGGKTTLMFNIGFNMAKAGYNVVYVSLEKKAIPFFIRLLSLHALVDYNRIKEGGKGEHGINEEAYTRLKDAAIDLKENIKPNFEIIQCAQGTKLSKIISEVEKVKKKHKIDVLIVDYLGVIGNETSHANRPDLDDAITSQRLQAYGRINDFVTISAAQLTKSSTKEIRKKSQKSEDEIEVHTEDIGGTKLVMADADNALSAVINPERTKMFVFGTKARDDSAHCVMVLDFDGNIGLVSDPIFEPGQVKEIDDVLYNTDMSEDDLDKEEILYQSSKKNDAKNSASVSTDALEKLFDDNDELNELFGDLD